MACDNASSKCFIIDTTNGNVFTHNNDIAGTWEDHAANMDEDLGSNVLPKTITCKLSATFSSSIGRGESHEPLSNMSVKLNRSSVKGVTASYALSKTVSRNMSGYMCSKRIMGAEGCAREGSFDAVFTGAVKYSIEGRSKVASSDDASGKMPNTGNSRHDMYNASSISATLTCPEKI